MRRAAAVALAALTVAAPVAAGWHPTGSGTGSGKAKSMTTATGNKPTATASGRNVTVAWAASPFSSGGGNVPSYVIRRFDALGAAQTVGAACSGVVSGLSCVESNVPPGTWQYTVRPAAGTSWRGIEGPKSDVIIVV